MTHSDDFVLSSGHCTAYTLVSRASDSNLADCSGCWCFTRVCNFIRPAGVPLSQVWPDPSHGRSGQRASCSGTSGRLYILSIRKSQKHLALACSAAQVQIGDTSAAANTSRCLSTVLSHRARIHSNYPGLLESTLADGSPLRQTSNVTTNAHKPCKQCSSHYCDTCCSCWGCDHTVACSCWSLGQLWMLSIPRRVEQHFTGQSRVVL